MDHRRLTFSFLILCFLALFSFNANATKECVSVGSEPTVWFKNAYWGQDLGGFDQRIAEMKADGKFIVKIKTENYCRTADPKEACILKEVSFCHYKGSYEDGFCYAIEDGCDCPKGQRRDEAGNCIINATDCPNGVIKNNICHQDNTPPPPPQDDNPPDPKPDDPKPDDPKPDDPKPDDPKPDDPKPDDPKPGGGGGGGGGGKPGGGGGGGGGGKPGGTDGGKPGGTDGGKPGGTDGGKPGGTDGGKPGGTDGGKPGGKPGGKGEDEDGEKEGTFSGSCDSPPKCTGDPVQCAIARATWAQKCEIEGKELSDSDCKNFTCKGDPIQCANARYLFEQRCANKELEDPENEFHNEFMKDYNNYKSNTIDARSNYDDKNVTELLQLKRHVSVKKSCPQDINVSFFGRPFRVDMGWLCDLLKIHSFILQAAAFLGGLRMLLQGL